MASIAILFPIHTMLGSLCDHSPEQFNGTFKIGHHINHR